MRIADDGEILVRGPTVFGGYWKRPAETAQVMRDGWFCTGDLGAIDLDGYLSITGRKKDLIVLSNGKKVAPAIIEGRVVLCDLVSQLIVYGDRRPYIVGLAVLREPLLNELQDARRTGAWEKELKLQETARREIDQLNESLSPHEQVRKFALLPEALSIENELLSPTLKPRRANIFARYQNVIEKLYAEP